MSLKNGVSRGGCLLIGALTLLTGCLETRSSVKEQEEKQVLRAQVAHLQQTSADVNVRFQGLEDEIRRLNGQLEVLENSIQQADTRLAQGSDRLTLQVQERDAAYREEFARLNTEFTRLNTEIEQLKSRLAALSEKQIQAQKQVAEERAKGPFALAEEKFEAKNYKEAILDYERYRKANPTGKQFATATYKIGLAFQELGLVDEAKAFYQEVVSKFPKSKVAPQASKKLKTLK